jgi:hypothetical protein
MGIKYLTIITCMPIKQNTAIGRPRYHEKISRHFKAMARAIYGKK